MRALNIDCLVPVFLKLASRLRHFDLEDLVGLWALYCCTHNGFRQATPRRRGALWSTALRWGGRRGRRYGCRLSGRHRRSRGGGAFVAPLVEEEQSGDDSEY